MTCISLVRARKDEIKVLCLDLLLWSCLSLSQANCRKTLAIAKTALAYSCWSPRPSVHSTLLKSNANDGLSNTGVISDLGSGPTILKGSIHVHLVVLSTDHACGNAHAVAGDYYWYTRIDAVILGRWYDDQKAECCRAVVCPYKICEVVFNLQYSMYCIAFKAEVVGTIWWAFNQR